MHSLAVADANTAVALSSPESVHFCSDKVLLQVWNRGNDPVLIIIGQPAPRGPALPGATWQRPTVQRWGNNYHSLPASLTFVLGAGRQAGLMVQAMVWRVFRRWREGFLGDGVKGFQAMVWRDFWRWCEGFSGDGVEGFQAMVWRVFRRWREGFLGDGVECFQAMVWRVFRRWCGGFSGDGVEGFQAMAWRVFRRWCGGFSGDGVKGFHSAGRRPGSGRRQDTEWRGSGHSRTLLVLMLAVATWTDGQGNWVESGNDDNNNKPGGT